MDAAVLAERIEGALRVNRVFGEPISADGVTVIPVARIGGGGGGGSGRETPPAGAATEPTEDPAAAGGPGDRAARRPGGEGAGGGMGWTGQPCGVFVLHDGQVRWQPAVDVNRLVTAVAAVSVTALLAARAIVRARTRG